MCVFFLDRMFSLSLSHFFLKKCYGSLPECTCLHSFVWFFLALVHSGPGHSGIQHIRLQSLRNQRNHREIKNKNNSRSGVTIERTKQPPSSSAAATFKVVQKTRKRSGSVPHCPKMTVHFFFSPWIVVPSSPHTMTFPKNICFVSRWWQLKYFWEFSPRNLGKMNPFWRAYFSDGLVKNHQPGLVSTGKTRQSEATHLRDGNHLGTVPYLWVDLGIRRVFVMPKCGEFSKGIRAPKMAERFRWRIYI